MSHKIRLFTLLILLALVLAGGIVWAQGPGPQDVSIQAALGTAFTYQGWLVKGSTPVDDTCDFRFSLWDAQSGGSQVGSTLNKSGVSVADGYFTVQLDFGGGAFQGDARWLQIEVQCTGETAYTDLGLQPITPAPYALALPGLRTQQSATSPNLIGGYSGNSVTSGVVGATIGGGGDPTYTNRVTDNYGTVGGGSDNRAGDNAGTTSDADHATIGGGDSNTASAYAATIGGGSFNTASGSLGTVAGGNNNTASGDTATIGGGSHNTASGVYATISGGWANTASGVRSTIGGGYYNTASGQFATVPGGSDNVAQGDYSFAAGRKARAYNQGCFVLADATDAYEDCINDNRFVFRVTNAFYIWTSADHTAGTLLPTGGTSWASLSDRNVKENFASVDQARLLEALAAMPVQTWNLKAQSPQIRHVGPVAQDFNAAFGYLFGEVESPIRINNMDAVGVALAAAQGLYAQNREQAARIEALEAENAAQQERIDDLEARLAALEAQVNGAAPSRPLRSSLLPNAGLLFLTVGAVWATRRKGGAR